LDLSPDLAIEQIRLRGTWRIDRALPLLIEIND
jgi:hypothetical protein